jgi:uncharacterized membrane protein YkvA (DUF1232 family)
MMTRLFLKDRVKQLKVDVHALYLASKDSRVSWRAKALMGLVIGYAISPLDLIPDFIPILGLLDDFVIIPAGISLVRRMIPKDIMEECKQKAREEPISIRAKWIAVLLIVSIWLFAAYIILRLTMNLI